MNDRRPLAYVISPQPWEGFQVSKHHYARALASRGWRVIFVDPPGDLGRPGRMELRSTAIENVENLKYQTFFPYRLKFRIRWLFDLLMRLQALLIRRYTGRPDLVWDFDNAYQFRDLRPFRAGKTVFHLVDDVGARGLGDKHADHFLSLHPVFCRNAGSACKDDHIIGHGLGGMYVRAARSASTAKRAPGCHHIGFVGNLEARWIDWDAIAEMVARHPEAAFTFWGPYPPEGRRSAAMDKIMAAGNASFPGLTPPEAIIEQSGKVDVWLLPFVAEALQGGAALNSHKVLEYLSSGKAVLMSWLEAYEGSELVYMADSIESHDLPDRLDRLLANVEEINSPALQEARRRYAIERSYDSHLDRILFLIGISLGGEAMAGQSNAT